MVELLVAWEKDWLSPKTEAFILRQMCNAYRVDRVMAVPKLLPERTSIEQFDDVLSALATTDSERVWLQPEKTYQGKPLQEFDHPEDAVYIFGKAGENNMRFVKEGDHIVTIYTPAKVDFFSLSCAAMLLYSRLQHGN